MHNDDDFNVTQAGGDLFGRSRHRKCKIERCENGYIVEYETVNQNANEDAYNRTLKKTKVFITNADLLEFLQAYFFDEPKP